MYKDLSPIMDEETRNFLLNLRTLKNKELWEYLNLILNRLEEEFYAVLSKTAIALNVPEDEIQIIGTLWDEYIVGLELSGELIKTYPKDPYEDDYKPDLKWETMQRYIAEAILKIKKEFNITGYILDFLLELWLDKKFDNFYRY